jgi:hypothetical protein
VVTESAPMPRVTGVLSATVNITSGALSISERRLKPAKPKTAGAPTL